MGNRREIFQLSYLFLVVGAISLAVFLALDAFGVARDPFILDYPLFRTAFPLFISLGPLLALVLAGVLVYLSLNESSSSGRFYKALLLFLGFLLALGVAATMFHHGVLVKATSRAPEDHFPLLSIFLAIGIGLTLLFIHKGKFRMSGVTFMAVVPPSIVLAFWLGLRIDPQAITEARAQQIGQAIELYHQDTGAYPFELRQLEPDYLPLLLGPLTGRGQTWCYQSGEGYYRLGYVLFERFHQYGDGTPFWEPYYEIHISSAEGDPPAGKWICELKLENLKQIGGPGM